MNKGLKIIGGCLLSGSGMAVAGISSEWYFIILGFAMIVVGNILAIESRGNKNEFN